MCPAREPPDLSPFCLMLTNGANTTDGVCPLLPLCGLVCLVCRWLLYKHGSVPTLEVLRYLLRFIRRAPSGGTS